MTAPAPRPNEWARINPAPHIAPKGCVHESATGSSLDAEQTESDR